MIARGKKSAAGAFLTLIMLICRNSGSCRGNQCATNQVLYHLGSRGIEYDLLPGCQQQQMPVMSLQSVSPGRAVAQWTVKNAVVNEIAHAHNISAAQVLLAWVISHQGVMAIPKAATIAHVQQKCGCA
ncbi:aldo/keto reductase [Escherichia coli]